jgi:SAM-dependent methyltransferase
MRVRFRSPSSLPATPPAAPDARALIPRVLGRALRGDGAALRRAVGEQLVLSPADAVLEVGCGDGRLLLELVARTPQGVVVGVERDEWMVRHAIARTRPLIERGRVRVVAGESSDLSAFSDACFDKACAIDVVYFWSSPVSHLAEIRRVLRPGGRLLLGYVAPPPGAAVRSDDIVRDRGDVERWLALAGFVEVTSLTTHGVHGGGLTWTQGVRPAVDGIARAAH